MCTVAAKASDNGNCERCSCATPRAPSPPRARYGWNRATARSMTTESRGVCGWKLRRDEVDADRGVVEQNGDADDRAQPRRAGLGGRVLDAGHGADRAVDQEIVRVEVAPQHHANADRDVDLVVQAAALVGAEREERTLVVAQRALPVVDPDDRVARVDAHLGRATVAHDPSHELALVVPGDSVAVRVDVERVLERRSQADRHGGRAARRTRRHPARL